MINLNPGQLQSHGQYTVDAKKSPSSEKADKLPATANVEDSVQLSKAKPAAEFDVDEVVGNIVDYLKSSIRQAQLAGATETEINDMRAQGLEGVATGIGEAKDILKGLGQLDDALEAKIDESYQRIVDSFEGGSLEQPATVQRNSVEEYYRNYQSLTLELQTRDGDKVSLSIAQNSEQGLAFLQEQSSSGSLLAASWFSEQSGQLNFSVKGELDAEEQEAIASLLKDIGALADKFYNGDLQQAFDQAKSLDFDETQLTSMNLHLKEIEQYSSVRQSSVSPDEQLSAKQNWDKPLRAYAQQLVELARRQDENPIEKRDWPRLMQAHPQSSEPFWKFAHSLFDRLGLVS